jgi:prepilin-type N-terminal cleavage/methylation domain-containing protein/prepilin-type processing-associated H-X9-DG protein
MPRRAFTLIELLVVLGIIAILVALLMPAIQRVRDAAARTQCLNNLKQIALATHQYHDSKKVMPTGMRWNKAQDGMLMSSWLLAIVPYLEQEPVWKQALASYKQQRDPFRPTQHPGLATVIPTYVCPADPRAGDTVMAQLDQWPVAMTSYLGVIGRDLETNDGVLYRDSRHKFGDITDGLSNTLLCGERPGSPDNQFGWWYAGAGQRFTGSCDMILGVEELNKQVITAGSCPPGRYGFAPGSINNPCDMFHFWSQHAGGGGQFAFCDGSARFLSYGAAPIMPALASRAGGETVGDF